MDKGETRNRGLQEVAHFFLSLTGQTETAPTEPEYETASFFPGIGLAGTAEKDGPGIIVLDRDKIVSFANQAAKALLGVRQEYRGQLFNYYIGDEESRRISIFRRNKKAGIGEMWIRKAEWLGERVYVISVRDITEELCNREGETTFSA